MLQPTKNIVYQASITLATAGHHDIHNITADVAWMVAASNVQIGLAHIFNIGSTAALGTIEFESGLGDDLPAMLDRLIPPSPAYGHEQAWHDGNGHSHLQATLLGPSLTVPVRQNQLALGEWQQIFHLECDTKPRNRVIVVTVMGE